MNGEDRERLDRIETKIDAVHEEVHTLRVELVGEYVQRPLFYFGIGGLIALIGAVRILG